MNRCWIYKYVAGAVVLPSVLLSSVTCIQAQTLSTGLNASMDSHLETMENNLSANPGDKKLAKRLEKARSLSNMADNCLKMENIVDDALEISTPTAGISSLMGDIAGPSGWHESYYGYVIDCLSLNEDSDYFYGYYGLPEVRKELVNTALSCEGRIKYVWGGKPASPDYLSSWEEGIGGLDCSGFVSWVYWHTLNTENVDSGLLSTYSISRSQEEISHEELLPGDLGMITDEGTSYTDIAGNKFFARELAVSSSQRLRKEYQKQKEEQTLKGKQTDKKKAKKAETSEKNTRSDGKEQKIILTPFQLASPDARTHASHVGIYVGKDQEGNEIWCHCTGGNIRTVVVGSYDRFQHYYRVLSVRGEEDSEGRH